MLEIALLGAPDVRRKDRGAKPTVLRPAEIELLAFVALRAGRPVPRDLIIAALWQHGADVACRRRLNTALWRLRNAIERGLPRGTFLHSDRSSVMIDACAVELDVSRFESAIDVAAGVGRGPLDDTAAAALQDGVDVYTGDLLEGRYTDWVIEARERLLGRYLGALSRLLGWYFDRGDFEATVVTGTRLLERDPLREDVHRVVIRSYGRLGARSRAIEQYRQCRKVLATELGLEPLPETTAALGDADVRGITHAREPGRGLPADAVLAHLRDLRTRVTRLAAAIDSAIDQLAP